MKEHLIQFESIPVMQRSAAQPQRDTYIVEQQPSHTQQ